MPATKAIGQKKKIGRGQKWQDEIEGVSSKNQILSEQQFFAANTQDKTNVEIVSCDCCNQLLCGASHSQVGKTSLPGAAFPGRERVCG